MKLFNKKEKNPNIEVANNGQQQVPANVAQTPQQPASPTAQNVSITTGANPSINTPVSQNNPNVVPTVSNNTKAPSNLNSEKKQPVKNTQINQENSNKKPETTEDGKRTNKLKGYSYVVINSMNKKEKGFFDAETEDEVRHFLEGQDYKVLEVKPKSAMDIDISGPPKLKPEDLSFALTQLSTYIKSGIPLVDSVRILAKQARKPAQKYMVKLFMNY